MAQYKPQLCVLGCCALYGQIDRVPFPLFIIAIYPKPSPQRCLYIVLSKCRPALFLTPIHYISISFITYFNTSLCFFEGNPRTTGETLSRHSVPQAKIDILTISS